MSFNLIYGKDTESEYVIAVKNANALFPLESYYFNHGFQHQAGIQIQTTTRYFTIQKKRSNLHTHGQPWPHFRQTNTLLKAGIKTQVV